VLQSSTYPGLFWFSTEDNNESNPDDGGADWNIIGGVSTTDVTGTSTTYSNSDIGKQVNRSNSGTTMFDTLPGTSPGQIADTGVVNIFNNDASALLVISPGSGASLKGALSYNGFLVLGPGQSANIISDGTDYWIAAKPDRVVLGANTTIYVSTSGSDSTNSGLTSGSAFASMQMAWNTLLAHFDLNGFTVTVQLANGTYAQGLHAASGILGSTGPGSVVFQGSTTAANVKISVSSSLCFWASAAGASFTVQGMTLTGSSLSYGLYAANSGIINFGSSSYPVVFGSMGVGSHMVANNGGAITGQANYSITGGSSTHIEAAAGGSISLVGLIISLTGTPAFSTDFAFSTSTGSIAAGGNTFAGSATGQRYSATLNGVINTNGGGASYFPGNSAGSTATGGQYA